MGSPQVQIVQDLTVALDYGQLHLYTADEDPDLASELLGEAFDADGIAQHGGLVVVASPHQNNVAMAFRVEVWDTAPLPDIAEWQEAFEVHLEVDEYGLTYASPTADSADLTVPAGAYHALITGRGGPLQRRVHTSVGSDAGPLTSVERYPKCRIFRVSRNGHWKGPVVVSVRREFQCRPSSLSGRSRPTESRSHRWYSKS
jgi:hypothetical protein